MLSTLLALGGFLDPKQLVERGGLPLVAAIIFAESGLLVGFFLPGDSLLFLTGFFVSKPPDAPHINTPLPVVLLILFAAATIGDQVGYWFGARVGPALFNRPDSRLFKQANVTKAQTFFDKYGAKTIVLCRFVPVVRTFAPIVAGVGKMRYRTFVLFNVIGAALWAVGVTTLGYYLGKRQFIRDNIELSLIAIVVLSTLPIIFELVRHRRAAKA
jgi:membrane-associated protein